jgi:putative tryptophan/tyrosine transport system substrate-binding protein
VIGYLSSGTAARPVDAGFHQGLSEIGYVEGQNLAIEYRWAEGQYDRLAGLVADLVGRKVEVIATVGMPSALAAKKATSSSMSAPILLRMAWSVVLHGRGPISRVSRLSQLS